MVNIYKTVWQETDGKVFRTIKTGVINDSLILIGENDNISNYDEVDRPIPQEVETYEQL